MTTSQDTPAVRTAGVPTTPENSGNTKISIGQQTVPRLPHERDESADSQVSPPRKVIQQAARDIKSGLKDTDRAAEVNATYKKLKARS